MNDESPVKKRGGEQVQPEQAVPDSARPGRAAFLQARDGERGRRHAGERERPECQGDVERAGEGERAVQPLNAGISRNIDASTPNTAPKLFRK